MLHTLIPRMRPARAILRTNRGGGKRFAPSSGPGLCDMRWQSPLVCLDRNIPIYTERLCLTLSPTISSHSCFRLPLSTAYGTCGSCASGIAQENVGKLLTAFVAVGTAFA